jgi:RHS repeat-associated protein
MTTLAGKWTYGYDRTGQLTSVALPTGSTVQYNYDAAGNRTSVVSSGGTVDYDVNNQNQYTSVGGGAYRYDQDGNLISRVNNGNWSYTYDADNHLTSVTGPSDTWTYEYDSIGNRTAVVKNGVRSEYLVDPVGIGYVIGEFDSSGNATNHYAYGVDLASALPASGNAEFYQYDDSGNTTAVTGAAGSVLNSYTFLPFGEPQQISEAISNPFTFVGQFGVMDGGNGLYYMRARYYTSAIGRFNSKDPVFRVARHNEYVYTDNIPLSYIDPNGLNKERESDSYGSESSYVAKNSSWIRTFAWVADKISGYFCTIKEACFITQKPTDVINNIAVPVVKQMTNDAVLGAGRLPSYCAFELYNSDCIRWKKELDENSLHPILSTSPAAQNSSSSKGSGDPNAKMTTGFGDQGYITPNSPITYTIYYENESNATAAAAMVVVTDRLDANLDWSTVQLTELGFNGVKLTPSTGAQTYTGRATVSTDSNPVAVSAALDADTGILTWTMQSIDTTTGAGVTDPAAGFLPPNNSSHQGEGYVTFTVMPKSGLTNGTAIYNQAAIVFDANASISTNKVTNTIDSAYPTSNIDSLPATTTNPKITVSWSGNDSSGSGIASYDIYASTDGTAWALWQSATTATSAIYDATGQKMVWFYSLATDNVGHRQQVPGTVQTTQIITQVTPTITWAQPAAITYGTALSAAQLNASASVPGTFSYSPTGGTVLPAGPQTLSVTFMPTDTGAYTTAAQTVTLQVNQATPSVMWMNPTAIIYGTSLTATQLNATASVPGNFVYSPAIGTVLQAGTQTLGATFTPTDSANYSIVATTATLTVGQAKPVVTWAMPASIDYGTTLNSMQLNATASVPGSFTYNPSAGSLLPSGAQKLSVNFTPFDATDYEGATASTSLQVLKATPVITWPVPAAVGYGTGLSAVQLNASSTVPGSFTYTPALGSVLPLGANILRVVFTPTDTSNYNSSQAQITLNVFAGASPILWSQPQAITYGTPLTGAQLNATSTIAGNLSYSPGPGTVLPAGAQTLTVTFTPIDTAHYAITTATVSVIVNKATPAVAWAQPAAIIYGTALGSSQLNASSTTPGTFIYSPTAGTVLTAGTESVTATFQPTDAGNYAPVVLSRQITVNQASPVITWNAPASITYGTALSATQLNAAASVPGSFSYSPTAGTVLTVGTSTLTATFTPADSVDYKMSTTSVAITVTGGASDFWLSVNPASQVLRAGSSTAFVVTANATGGIFSNSVQFSVAGVPAGATAVFSPATVALGTSTATSTLTITMPKTAAMIKPAKWRLGMVLPLTLSIFALPFSLSRTRAKVFSRTIVLLGIFCASMVVNGCLTTQSSIGDTVLITVSSGSTSHGISVTVVDR